MNDYELLHYGYIPFPFNAFLTFQQYRGDIGIKNLGAKCTTIRGTFPPRGPRRPRLMVSNSGLAR